MSPATVSFPVALTEAVVLAVGLGTMVVATAVLALHQRPQPRQRRQDAPQQREIERQHVGFDVGSVPEGAGIRGMRERALLAGAALDIKSRPGVGTTVRLQVPVRNPSSSLDEPGAHGRPATGL